MTGLHPSRLKPRDERAHPVVRDAIEGGFAETGEVYRVPGLPGHDIANQSRMSIRAAGQHLGVSVAAWVVDAGGEPCWKACKDPDAPHGAFFRIFPKTEGRRHVVQQTGGDPSKLKYNPFKKAEPRMVDDNGQRIR
jgi:hypothetical protein